MSKPLVLVTGATGHIGFRTLVEALRTGFRARVAVRSLTKVESIKSAKSVQPYLEDIEFVEVPDITARGAFDVAARDVEFVLHLASAIPDEKGTGTGSAKEFYVDPAVNGTVGMLESAAKSRTVKRIVITSTLMILAPRPGASSIGPDDLAPVPDLDNIPQDPWGAYEASKILAHHASEQWMSSHEVSFDVVHVLPAFVQGRNELVLKKEDVGNGSNVAMMDFVLGRTSPEPRISVLVLVDDVAKVEVASLDLSKAKGGDRFVAALPQQLAWNDVDVVVRRLFPEAVENGTLPLGVRQESRTAVFDSSKTTEILGVQFAGLEAMVESTVGQYVELASKA